MLRRPCHVHPACLQPRSLFAGAPAFSSSGARGHARSGDRRAALPALVVGAHVGRQPRGEGRCARRRGGLAAPPAGHREQLPSAAPATPPDDRAAQVVHQARRGSAAAGAIAQQQHLPGGVAEPVCHASRRGRGMARAGPGAGGFSCGKPCQTHGHDGGCRLEQPRSHGCGGTLHDGRRQGGAQGPGGCMPSFGRDASYGQR
mmetsp:Transcript_3624/g.7080  ORF Transcript_3624/g.7080 Transcript_3624/m.7080 type:complete len:202 (-) Transcript_3624:904-1509(-)